MVKRGISKQLEEISVVISKIKAILAGDDGSSTEFTSKMQGLEKHYLNRLYQALETSSGKSPKKQPNGH